MNNISEDIYNAIESLCKEGDTFVEKCEFNKAIAKYSDAYAKIQDPKENFEASTWINVAIGDAYFLMKDFNKAKNSFYNALNCLGGNKNPFIHLRLGQCLFELKELSKSADHLTGAYMIEGKKIFDEDDNKYFDFLETKIKSPPEGF